MSRVDIRIENLLPHRDRLLLVDEIIAVNDKSAVTSATVTDQWPFFDGKAVNPLILLELTAQTAGINNGWVRMKEQGQDSEKKGWLVGIKQSRFFIDAIPINTRIITHSENQFEFEGYRHILGSARIGPDIVAEIELQLIQVEPK
ncbi:hypothetical protein ACFL0M_02550 [Thermodesulfobacteriota bacterium]